MDENRPYGPAPKGTYLERFKGYTQASARLRFFWARVITSEDVNVCVYIVPHTPLHQHHMLAPPHQMRFACMDVLQKYTLTNLTEVQVQSMLGHILEHKATASHIC